VMGEASRVRAVLAGQASHPPELYTAPFQPQSPRLDFIVGAQSLREGERMITSGDGGLYPRGIPVGLAHRDGDGAWHVALAAAQRPIDFVRIVPYVGAAQPEGTAQPNEAPPLNSTSTVAAVSRSTMAPPPTLAATPAVARAPRATPARDPNAAAPPQPLRPTTTPAPAPQTQAPTLAQQPAREPEPHPPGTPQ